MVSLIVQPSEGALDHSGQLASRTIDGQVQRGSLMRSRDGLAAFEAGFHHAAHVVIAHFLVAVLIAQVDFHPRDVIAEPTQGTIHDAAYLRGLRYCDRY